MIKSRIQKRNILASQLAFISGILLIISGTSGVGNVGEFTRILLRYVHLQIITPMFLLLLLIAGFGGFSVMIGGILILKNRVNTGRIIIMLGSGAGVLTLSLNILLSVYTKSISMAWFLSSSTIGMLLAISAQMISVKNKR